MAERGSRPVSVDLARGLPLSEHLPAPASDTVALRRLPALPPQIREAFARLSITRWPTGHRIAVCSLDGGVGRTAIAAGLAAVLAPRFSTLLFDASGRRLSNTGVRWGVHPLSASVGLVRDKGDQALPSIVRGWVGCTPSGAHALLSTDGEEVPVTEHQSVEVLQRLRAAFEHVVIDAPAGLPSDLPWTTAGDAAPATVILVSRPDEASLNRLAEVVVWMNDHAGLQTKQHINVVVNHGVGKASRASKAAKTMLATRCGSVSDIPFANAFQPNAPPPTVPRLSNPLNLKFAQILLGAHQKEDRP